MQLLYLWINDYRCIKHQGFNFGGEHIFSFDSELDKLTCEDNPDYIADFFGPRIINTTAIIGANGSGKSTLLDFIKLNISADIGVTNLQYLCIFKVKNRDEVFVYNSLGRKVQLPQKKGLKFTLSNRGRIDGELSSLLFPTAFIYYSPVLEYDNDPEYVPIDLSTTRLIKRNDSSFSDVVHDEIIRQLKFSSKYRGILPFKMPDALHMAPNRLNDRYSSEKYHSKDVWDDFDFLRAISEAELYRKRGELETPYIEIQKAFFEYSYHYLLNRVDNIEGVKKFRVNQFKTLTDNPTWEIIKALYSINPTFHALVPLKVVEQFFSLIKTLEQSRLMDYWGGRYNFEIGQNIHPQIYEFFDLYNKLSKVGNFLHFYWSGLSTGEQSFFSLFARFYSAREDVRLYMDHINDCRVNVHDLAPYNELPDAIILIDEGETHLHPQWQRDFMFNLTKYLPSILHLPKIQLILCSNSPFLISDLPKQNIIFLKSSEGNTQVINSQVVSFAANIHDLLGDSFFLDSTIGKLAETKINDIVRYLTANESQQSFTISEIKKTILLVDDQIVRNKLLQLYNVKFNNDNWEEELLKDQQDVIDKKLKQIQKERRSNAKNK